MDSPPDHPLLEQAILIPDERTVATVDKCFREAITTSLDTQRCPHAYALSAGQRAALTTQLDQVRDALLQAVEANTARWPEACERLLPESPDDAAVRTELRAQRARVRELEARLSEHRQQVATSIESLLTERAANWLQQVERLQAELQAASAAEEDDEDGGVTTGEGEAASRQQLLQEVQARYAVVMELMATLADKVPPLAHKAARLQQVIESFGSGAPSHTERFITEDARRLLRESLGGTSAGENRRPEADHTATVVPGVPATAADKQAAAARRTRATLAAAMRAQRQRHTAG
ncbi:hypothetical protein CDCA_CDCA10G3061 [Cyanidium caldarium]|uniref:Uncharacterized protein n=1 Tax=Cyanidium caldarium TaxID=2771 RepID=A0AAV9IY14_CYACA|nr:hypothetical protein CDCA_CDCA10G3061 [Cyanidium caldarium]